MRIDKMNDTELDIWVKQQYDINPGMSVADLIRLAFSTGHVHALRDQKMIHVPKDHGKTNTDKES